MSNWKAVADDYPELAAAVEERLAEAEKRRVSFLETIQWLCAKPARIAWSLGVGLTLIFATYQAVQHFAFRECLSYADCLWAAGDAPTEAGVRIRFQACTRWYPNAAR